MSGSSECLEHEQQLDIEDRVARGACELRGPVSAVPRKGSERADALQGVKFKARGWESL